MKNFRFDIETHIENPWESTASFSDRREQFRRLYTHDPHEEFRTVMSSFGIRVPDKFVEISDRMYIPESVRHELFEDSD